MICLLVACHILSPKVFKVFHKLQMVQMQSLVNKLKDNVGTTR